MKNFPNLFLVKNGNVKGIFKILFHANFFTEMLLILNISNCGIL